MVLYYFKNNLHGSSFSYLESKFVWNRFWYKLAKFDYVWILLIFKVQPQHPTTLLSFSFYPESLFCVHGDLSYDFLLYNQLSNVYFVKLFIFLFQHNCISNFSLPLGLSKKCSFWTNMEEQKRKPRGNA